MAAEGTNARQATLLALAAVLCWSTVATAFKLGLEVLTPVQLLLQGVMFSTCVFVVANSIVGHWRLTRALALRGAGRGLLNPFAYYQILFAPYDRLPAQLAQSVNYTWAIVLALLAAPLLGQRLGGRTLCGIVVSYAGVLIITLGVDGHSGLEWDGSGFALALGSTVVWVGVVEMGITLALWSTAMRRTAHAARIGQLIFLAPFLSLLLIENVLDEPVPASSWAGLGIIVTGLLIAGPVRMAAKQ